MDEKVRGSLGVTVTSGHEGAIIYNGGNTPNITVGRSNTAVMLKK